MRKFDAVYELSEQVFRDLISRWMMPIRSVLLFDSSYYQIIRCYPNKVKKTDETISYIGHTK